MPNTPIASILPRWMWVAFGLLLVSASVLGALTFGRQQSFTVGQRQLSETLAEVRQSQRQNECYAILNAQMLGVAFTALSAPPAPNTQRDAAVQLGLALARELDPSNPIKACP